LKDLNTTLAFALPVLSLGYNNLDALAPVLGFDIGGANPLPCWAEGALVKLLPPPVGAVVKLLPPPVGALVKLCPPPGVTDVNAIFNFSPIEH
jgi:hypothetical protein